MKLHRMDVTNTAPETAGPPLLLAHGLFGQGRNFASLARRLAAGRDVAAVDMRNHGASPHAAEMTYPAMAEDLAETIDDLGAGPAQVLGHSMGGKAAMALALTAPERVERLIVADIAPMAYAHSHGSYVAAMQSVDLGTVKRRSEAGRVMADGVPDAALRAFLLQSLDIGPEGARWRLNLDALAAGMPDIVGWPDWPETAVYDGPALFLTGGASDYVPETARPEILRRFPAARFADLPGAGHWLHAEQPEAFAAAVETFLAGGPQRA